MENDRDFLISALEKRQSEDNSPEARRYRGLATIGLPDALAGQLGVIFSTIYVDPATSPFPAKNSYETPQQAYDLASKQLDYYYHLIDTDERLKIIHDQNDLESVLASWQHDSDNNNRKIGLVILMEGADPIVEPRQAEEWYERGVRIIGLAWSQTRYAGGTSAPGPLTKIGFELIEVMADLGMILDLSHLAEEAYFQAVEHYKGVLLASHSNPRHFLNHDRMLSDDMIMRLVERDSVMGLVPFNRFMSSEWQPSHPKEAITIDHYIDMIDYVCQLAGSARHVGIGSDWDGGFGSEAIPHPFDTAADLWLLNDALANRGYSTEDIQGILGHNFLRVLTQGLKK